MNTNENFVLPKVYFIGATDIDIDGLVNYLMDTRQDEFAKDISQAQKEGLSNGEILCSFYAKLCYASLKVGKNKNISKVRSIHSNLLATIESGHGSVFEHCSLNFVITNCSRVFTHELVRHRVGTAFSQTSGRYVRNDVLKIVVDPILEPVSRDIERVREQIEYWYQRIETQMMAGVTDFDQKKKITSALRRIMPNGQANEIGFSVNLRMLRNVIAQRTSIHAEWEIREVFYQIYSLVKDKYPAIFADATDNNKEITFKNNKI